MEHVGEKIRCKRNWVYWEGNTSMKNQILPMLIDENQGWANPVSRVTSSIQNQIKNERSKD